jgi:hypothetical protein
MTGMLTEYKRATCHKQPVAMDPATRAAGARRAEKH